MRGDPEPIGEAARTEDRVSIAGPNPIRRGPRRTSGGPEQTVVMVIVEPEPTVAVPSRAGTTNGGDPGTRIPPRVYSPESIGAATADSSFGPSSYFLPFKRSLRL